MGKQTATECLGENLQQVMKARGLNAITLAARSPGAGRSTINNIRNGLNTSVESLDGVARGLGLPAWALLVPGLGPDPNGPALEQLMVRFLAASPSGRQSILDFALWESQKKGE